MPSLTSLVRLLLPRRCVACAAPGEWMCERCGPRLRALAAPLCGRCGAPTALVVTSCRACSRLRWLTTARSALWLEGPALALVGRWKRGEISPARLAAALMVHELPRPPVDAIAVVPAVRDRLLLRGADPPAELARELGGWWEVPVMPAPPAHARPCDRNAASMRRRAAATCAAHSPRVPARAAWRSWTTSTRRARPSTNVRARCGRRAPSTCTS